jgi:hypothetical protein
MKKFLFVAPLFSLIIQSANAVKTVSPEADAIALEAGRKAPAVCAQYIFFGEGENMVRVKGSGTLVRSDIVATAAHLFSSLSEEPEDYEAHIKKFTPGIPVKISGFVTFIPDATRAISDYEQAPIQENLSHFYEVDSVIIDPSFPIHNANFSPKYDRAFIKLKRPVQDIDPIPLYTQGTIPESKLKIHDQKLINDNEMSMENFLIDAYAYGYGSDIDQKFGQKRGIYQPCFIGRDVSSAANDDDRYSSDSEENESNVSKDDNSYSSDFTSSDKEWEDKTEVNVGISVPLTAYFPGTRENLESVILIDGDQHAFGIHPITNKFNNSLLDIINKKGEIAGIIDEGDSGGALIISGKLAGIVGQGNNYGEPLARNVKEFSDMPQLYQIYESFYVPLFNVKAGELLSEIPDMIKALQGFPVSDESNLKDFLLFDQRQRQSLKASLTVAISDLETLLLPDLSLEEFESIINKYSNQKQVINIVFEEELKQFKDGNLEVFKNAIQEKTEQINKYAEDI